MGYAPAHRLLTVVSDRKAQFARVGMRHTASLRNVLVLTALPSEAFRASGGGGKKLIKIMLKLKMSVKTSTKK